MDKIKELNYLEFKKKAQRLTLNERGEKILLDALLTQDTELLGTDAFIISKMSEFFGINCEPKKIYQLDEELKANGYGNRVFKYKLKDSVSRVSLLSQKMDEKEYVEKNPMKFTDVDFEKVKNSTHKELIERYGEYTTSLEKEALAQGIMPLVTMDISEYCETNMNLRLSHYLGKSNLYRGGVVAVDRKYHDESKDAYDAYISYIFSNKNSPVYKMYQEFIGNLSNIPSLVIENSIRDLNTLEKESMSKFINSFEKYKEAYLQAIEQNKQV